MASAYRPSPFFRATNAVVVALLRRGIGPGGSVLLTVPGRRSGLPRTTPVTLLAWNGERWLQSPFGEVDWVRNLRAAGSATLTRGRRNEAIVAVEVPPAEAARVYRGTFASFPAMVKSHFDIEPGSSVEAFEREAARHPMFRVIAADVAGPR